MSSQGKNGGLLLKHQLSINDSKLFSDLSEAVNGSLSCNAALTDGLRILCEFINWDYGEIWILDRDCNILQISPTW
jgi:hypothetical protein